MAGLLAGLGYAAVSFVNTSETLVRERCVADVGGNSYPLAPDQAANAALISALAVKRGLPPRAASIALATATQESKLRNIDHGHMDSLGLFQQRPSQGWGTIAQVTDPVHATNAFYDALIKVKGYDTLPVTDAAQRVQLSAFPEAYAAHEDASKAFASALTGYSPAALNCVLRKPTQTESPQRVEQELTVAFGAHSTSISNRVLTVTAAGTQGWAIAQWAVANAKQFGVTQVSHDGKRWVRRDGWQDAGGSAGDVRIMVADPQAVAD